MGNSGGYKSAAPSPRRREALWLVEFYFERNEARVLVEAGLPAERRACARSENARLWKVATVRARFVPERGASPNSGTLLSTAESVPNPPLGRGATQTATGPDTSVPGVPEIL